MLQNLEFHTKNDEPDRLEMFYVHVTCTNIMVKLFAKHAFLVFFSLGILCHSVLKTKNADYTKRKESTHHCNNKEFESHSSGFLPPISCILYYFFPCSVARLCI